MHYTIMNNNKNLKKNKNASTNKVVDIASLSIHLQVNMKLFEAQLQPISFFKVVLKMWYAAFQIES